MAALPTLSLAAAGLFDHTVVIFGLGASSSRERQVLRGHSDAVTAPAWASSASQLASGSADCTVIVWQLTDESLLVPAEPRRCMLEGHTDTIRTLCWLSDDILASGSLDHTIRLWRLENQDDHLSGECFQCLEHHSGPVTALALSTKRVPNDVGLLVSGSADRSICAWDWSPSSVNLVADKQQCHDLGVCAVCALPARHLATASTDTTIKIWTCNSRSVGRRLRLPANAARPYRLCARAELHRLKRLAGERWIRQDGPAVAS